MFELSENTIKPLWEGFILYLQEEEEVTHYLYPKFFGVSQRKDTQNKNFTRWPFFKLHHARILPANLRNQASGVRSGYLEIKMAEFKFNFASTESDDETDISPYETDAKRFCQPENVRQAKEIVIPCNVSSYLSSKVEEMVFGNGSVTIKHVSESNVETALKENGGCSRHDIVTAAECSTDLIPSVYEGGLKIWKCSVDLVEYLIEGGLKFEGKRVLEIGCGAGLPGIFTLLQGAEVDFQDYNEDVIEYVTIPNVLLNVEQMTKGKACESDSRITLNLLPAARKRCRFYSGDWGSVVDFINPEQVKEKMYDVVLTSETIYSLDSYSKLYNFIKRHLKKPDGAALVAAKTHYFGVGGGTRTFEEMIKMDGVFDISVCKVYSGGVQREILCMRYNTEDTKQPMKKN